MEKEITCVDECFAQDMVEEVTDDLMCDDGLGMAIDTLDDDYSDGDLIDSVMKGEY